MTPILTLLALGFGIGYLTRNRALIVSLTSKLTDLSIYILLFFLGVSVASTPGISEKLLSLGLPALTLSISGILGSCILARLAFRWIRLDR
jgi:uncharacterized membrane protein YbjE (DUF340 family)